MQPLDSLGPMSRFESLRLMFANNVGQSGPVFLPPECLEEEGAVKRYP